MIKRQVFQTLITILSLKRDVGGLYCRYVKGVSSWKLHVCERVSFSDNDNNNNSDKN